MTLAAQNSQEYQRRFGSVREPNAYSALNPQVGNVVEFTPKPKATLKNEAALTAAPKQETTMTIIGAGVTQAFGEILGGIFTSSAPKPAQNGKKMAQRPGTQPTMADYNTRLQQFAGTYTCG